MPEPRRLKPRKRIKAGPVSLTMTPSRLLNGVWTLKTITLATMGTPPMDIEWAKDGTTGKIWIVQARPENSAISTSTRSIATGSRKPTWQELLALTLRLAKSELFEAFPTCPRCKGVIFLLQI
jgi:hypothetical protein